MNKFDNNYLQIERELAHWTMATVRLGDLDNLASSNAWHGLERYLGVAIREKIKNSVIRLKRVTSEINLEFSSAVTLENLQDVSERLVQFRKKYLRTETTADFYADAINTRLNPKLVKLLRSYDYIAKYSMNQLLKPLGHNTPLVLTYIDKGLGASILKAGLRLWDGGLENPAAVIKIVRHNMYRPTSLIHEAGHQVAHITNWNDELRSSLYAGLENHSENLANVWASWSSEIAADAFAFVHTGYASVAALHDVLSGDSNFVFRYTKDDPHPISYLRVLLGVQMCRTFYGDGPWDILAQTWQQRHPSFFAQNNVKEIVRHSIPILSNIANITLKKPMKAFGGRSLSSLIIPDRVSPASLYKIDNERGMAFYNSPYLLSTDPLRFLALTGLKTATKPKKSMEILKQQETGMLNLGSQLELEAA